MNIQTIPVGPYETNCYFFCDEKNNVWIIDPGNNGESLAQIIKTQSLTPQGVLLTHSHWDHIIGLPALLSHYPVPVHVHAHDATVLTPKGKKILMERVLSIDHRFALAYKQEIEMLQEAEILLNAGDFIKGSTLKVLHTPGHTPGSVCYWDQESGILFSGDTLFHCGIGRTDFPGGSITDMEASLNKLATLAGTTKVYPGHGSATTIEDELR